MFVTRWSSSHPRAHIAEKDFVLGCILNSTYMVSTIPFVWLPVQPDMGLLGQLYVLGWATGPINLTLIILVTNRPPQYVSQISFFNNIFSFLLRKYLCQVFFCCFFWISNVQSYISVSLKKTLKRKKFFYL